MLTAIYCVVMPRVEMAVRSIFGSSGRGPNIIVQYPDQRDLTGNMEDTPRMAGSSRIDLNINQTRNNIGTESSKSFDNGNLLALTFSYNQQMHAHRTLFKVNSMCLHLSWEGRREKLVNPAVSYKQHLLFDFQE